MMIIHYFFPDQDQMPPFECMFLLPLVLYYTAYQSYSRYPTSTRPSRRDLVVVVIQRETVNSK